MNSEFRFKFNPRRCAHSRTVSRLMKLFFCSNCSIFLCTLWFISLSAARFCPCSLFDFKSVYASTCSWSRRNLKFWELWFHLASNLVLTKSKQWILKAHIENLLFGWFLRYHVPWKGCLAGCKIPGASVFFASSLKSFCFAKFLWHLFCA